MCSVFDLDDIAQEHRDILGTSDDSVDRRHLGQPWTGETGLLKYVSADEPGYTNVAGRRTRGQNASRPPNVCPDMWQMLSAKNRQEVIDAWKELEPQYEAAMNIGSSIPMLHYMWRQRKRHR